jgi:phosphate transport system permease protein
MLILLVLLALTALSAGAYAMGRGKARATASAGGGRPHSLPGYHGSYVALWTGLPAAILLFAFIGFGSRFEAALIAANPPPAAAGITQERLITWYGDVQSTANGQSTSAVVYQGAAKTAFDAAVADARRTDTLVRGGVAAAALVIALAGFLLAFPRISKDFRARNRVEGWTAALLIVCSVVAIMTTVGIVMSLLYESLRFFHSVPILDFLFGTDWDAQIAMRADQIAAKGSFGAVPLFAGTFLIMIIAMAVAAPIGLFSAIYLAEYAGRGARATIKPMLEILAGIPTVVYGFFAALTVGPLFRAGFNALGAELIKIGGPLAATGEFLAGVQNQMALVAGAVMGIMLIPFVSSLSDDIINAVPQSLRDGSYAMGATKSETIRNVVMPAALPGIMAALLLAVSRAIGETMIVVMAAGAQANLTANPLRQVTTVTYQIVVLLTGDQEFDNPRTLAAFGLGLTLFAVTLMLNVVALRIVQKYREQYD